jgi:5-methyltetrahydrofolate--homocysteine methyltransferase
MATPEERRKELEDILEQRVLVLDGAMGTMLQQQRLTTEDFGALPDRSTAVGPPLTIFSMRSGSMIGTAAR